MVSLPYANGQSTLHDLVETVAIYACVSTEDQAERKTVEAQLDMLRKLADLHGWHVAREYVDHGVSGTVPLDQREAGQRLLEDAAARRFGTVLLYRLDRLGRSIRVLLDAHQALDTSGTVLKSATEPFDTASPIGRFVFQLLGSIAELERSTIAERTTLGRARVARTGRWTSGPIPFGYDLDEEGCLILSMRLVPALGITEAELVRQVYERMAAGSTLVAEAQRMNALGVRTERHYSGGKAVRISDRWFPGRISSMLRNPLYRGVHLFASKHGVIERTEPALVSPELWEQVQQQLARNRAPATKNAKTLYLLRGLIVCENCGLGYSGSATNRHRRQRQEQYGYYRCNNTLLAQKEKVEPSQRCCGKLLARAWLENLVWEDCRAFILNPGDTLAEAQRALRARMTQAAGLSTQRRALQRQIAEKDAERERILTLYRRNRITVTEAETQLDAVAQELADLRQMADAVTTQQAVAEASEGHITSALSMLVRLQEQLAEIEPTNDWHRKREIVELLVSRIGVRTDRPGHGKQARLTLRYAFGELRAVVSAIAWRKWPCPSPSARS